MQNLQAILDALSVRPEPNVDPAVLEAARLELATLERSMPRVIADPRPTNTDALVMQFGELFCLFEEWVLHQRQTGQFTHLRPDVAAALCDSAEMLKRHGYEPARMPPSGPMTFRKPTQR